MAVKHEVTFESGYTLSIENKDSTYTLGLVMDEKEGEPLFELWTTITHDEMYDLEGLIGKLLH